MNVLKQTHKSGRYSTAAGAIPSRDSVECHLRGHHRDSRLVLSAVQRSKGSSVQKTSSTCSLVGVPPLGALPSILAQVTPHTVHMRKAHILIRIHSVFCQLWARRIPHDPRSYITRTTTRAATGTRDSTVSLHPAPSSPLSICVLLPLRYSELVFHTPGARSALLVRVIAAIQPETDDADSWRTVSRQFG